MSYTKEKSYKSGYIPTKSMRFSITQQFIPAQTILYLHLSLTEKIAKC